MDTHAGRPFRAARIFVRIVADERDALRAFGSDLIRDLVDASRLPFDRLAAGHRHGVVEEDLVGDVDAGGRRGADRQDAGMRIGAVAEILEDVVAAGERRLADPVRPLPAHLREAFGGAVHPQRHVVAADAGIGAAALGHLVETLCGQPEQKCGARTPISWVDREHRLHVLEVP